MFLEFMEQKYADQFDYTKLCRENSTFNGFYIYWKEHLFERVMKLFVWENTESDDKKLSIKPKEIEQRLMLSGTCGITKISSPSNKVYNELTAMYGTLHGVTKYLDERTNFIVNCPIYTGDRTIGKDVVVIDNTSLRNGIMPLIHHYSIMLAHADVTLVDTLVNARDCGGVPIVTTEKQKQSVLQYQAKVFNGQYGVVTDRVNKDIAFLGNDRHTSQDIMAIMEVREKLIKSFYSAIGIRSAFEKRNNSIQAEVEADTSLLQLNLSDMIACREKGAEEVNNMFGTNWTVHIAEEIDYGAENQRVQFDTFDTIHVDDGGEMNETI